MRVNTPRVSLADGTFVFVSRIFQNPVNFIFIIGFTGYVVWKSVTFAHMGIDIIRNLVAAKFASIFEDRQKIIHCGHL